MSVVEEKKGAKKGERGEKVFRRQLIFRNTNAAPWKVANFINSFKSQGENISSNLFNFPLFQPIFSHQELFLFPISFATIITHSSNIGSSSAKSSRARRGGAGSEPISSYVLCN
jgi:hypothetical protein